MIYIYVYMYISEEEELQYLYQYMTLNLIHKTIQSAHTQKYRSYKHLLQC